MAIRFDCPNCKTHYEVADDLAGKMIMCRGCQKRGAVRGLAASTTASTLPAGSKSSAFLSTRRTFLIGSIVASLGAIGTGALLARWRPWRRLGEPERPSGGRGRRPPPPPNDGKEAEKKGPGV